MRIPLFTFAGRPAAEAPPTPPLRRDLHEAGYRASLTAASKSC